MSEGIPLPPGVVPANPESPFLQAINTIAKIIYVEREEHFPTDFIFKKSVEFTTAFGKITITRENAFEYERINDAVDRRLRELGLLK